ncbi:MAG TPA: CPBP family intramembrane glutamic endopeptidase [Pseudonocardiaceae bacterium]|nr:CPBP family intramembrane glutamic endopeptidase [Pseudonocardiaceae bacterium]
MPNVVRDWLRPASPNGIVGIEPEQRRATGLELLIVFAATLGWSGLRSLISLLDSLASPVALNKQQALLNPSLAKVHLLDLFAQLADALQLLAWGSLGAYLVYRAGLKLAEIGLDRSRIGSDVLRGVGLAALIGIPGLGFYLLARTIGINLTVVPAGLSDTWWRVPVLVISAAANAWAEEALVVGYLLTRLRQLGRTENTSLVISAVLRGSYHLYQGFGGFIGNIVLGLVFGRVWQKTNRLWPMVLAHTILDVVSFVGYALLAGKLSFLR